MKKKEFFEWLKHFTVPEKEHLIKATKGLVPKQKAFFKDVVNKIKTWQSTSKSDRVDFEKLATTIEQNEGRTLTKGKFSDAVRNRLAPFLYRFIINNEADNDELLKNQILFKAVQKRHISDVYYYQYLDRREAANEAGTTPKSFEYYHEKSTIDYLRYFNAEFKKHTFKTTQNYTDFKAEEVLLDTWQNGQTAFLIKQYRLACEIRCRQLLVTDTESILKNVNFTYLDDQLSNSQSSESIALSIYAHLYDLFKKNDFKKIEPILPVIDKVLNNITFFTTEEQTSLLILLMNIVGRVKKINPTQTVIKTLERIAVFGIEKHIFGKESTIEENVFMNLHGILQNHDLREKIENDLVHFLSSENDQTWVKIYFNIQQHIKKKEYYNCLLLLENLNHQNNIHFAFRKYIFQLMYMLELKLEIREGKKSFLIEHEDAVNVDSFQNVLNNITYAFGHTKYLQKPTKEERKKFRNYVEVITLLYQDNIDKQKIKQLLESDTAMYAKAWLKQKFQNLSNP